MEYQLKVIINGKPATKTWDGKDGLNACVRYADCHPGHVVLAWRIVPHGIVIGVNASQIIG